MAPPASATEAPKLVITKWNGDVTEGCFEDRVPGGDKKPKKAKAPPPCSADVYYIIENLPTGTSSPAQATLTRNKGGVTTDDGTAKGYLTATVQADLGKQLENLVSYNSAFRTPFVLSPIPITPPKGKKAAKTAPLKVDIHAVPLRKSLIEFVMSGKIPSGDKVNPEHDTPVRKLLGELFAVARGGPSVPKGGSELVTKVLERLAKVTDGKTDPESVAQHARVNWLLAQLNQANALKDSLLANVVDVDYKDGTAKGYLSTFAYATVAYLATGLDSSGKPADNFLPNLANDIALKNLKGIKIVEGTPPLERSVDPYKFLQERSALLGKSDLYKDRQNGAGKRLADLSGFLETALKEQWMTYLQEDERRRLGLSLVTYADLEKPEKVEAYLSKELPNFNPTQIAGWRLWLSTRMGGQTNLRSVIEAIAYSATVKKIKGGGEVVEFDLTRITSTLSRLSYSKPEGAPQIAEQRNSLLTGVAVLRAIFAQNSPTTSRWILKPSIPVWSGQPIGLNHLKVEFINGTKDNQENFDRVQINWLSYAGVAPTAPSPTAPPAAKALPAPTPRPPVEPMGPPPPPAVEPPPARLPLVPTAAELAQPDKAANVTHWMFLGNEALITLIGVVLLATGSTADTARADQPNFGLGDPVRIHAGGSLLGSGLAGLGGRGISYLISRTSKDPSFKRPWKSIVPDLTGIVVGGILGGTLPLARGVNPSDILGSGPSGRSPSMGFPLRNN